MCRNIKTLFNFDPPATDDEIRASALQFVRKLSGFTKPSQANLSSWPSRKSLDPRAPWWIHSSPMRSPRTGRSRLPRHGPAQPDATQAADDAY